MAVQNTYKVKLKWSNLLFGAKIHYFSLKDNPNDVKLRKFQSKSNKWGNTLSCYLIFHVHMDTVCKKHARNCEDSEEGSHYRQRCSTTMWTWIKSCKNSRKEQKIERGRWLCVYCTCVCLRICCVQLVLRRNTWQNSTQKLKNGIKDIETHTGLSIKRHNV